MKIFLYATLFFLFLFCVYKALSIWPSSTRKVGNIIQSTFSSKKPENPKVLHNKLQKKAADLKPFLKNKGYNTQYCILIDMGIESGKERIFVYDLKKDTIVAKGLVTHGYGSNKKEIEFSNTPNSYCTSLGRYKIGTKYSGKFGTAYKLYGLDSTNSKAYERFVVLHSHACVPDFPIYPIELCHSQGCPTVSPAFLQKLEGYIDNSQKPMMMVIFR